MIKQVILALSLIYADKPILKDLTLAQAILESRLLTSPSTLATKYYNLFGIKKKGTNGYIALPTKENYKGKWITTKALFAYNNSIEDSIKQHRELMQKPRYQAVWNASTFEEAAHAVHKCGYATDPNYSKKLIEIYNNHIKTGKL